MKHPIRVGSLFGLIALLGPAPIGFSADHLDAPALNPLAGTKRLAADINDLYVFEGADPNSTVLAGTYSPAAGAIGPSTFGTDVIYQLNVVDAPTPTQFDVTADIAYRAIFDPPDAAGIQPFRLYKATGTGADGHSVNPADLFFSGFTGRSYDLPTGGKFFAGLRSDPFFFDLAGFQGSFGEASSGRSLNDGNQVDFFEDLNVLALVIEIPDNQLPDMDDDGVATWLSTADLDSGIQLDRTVFYPTGGGQPGDRGTLELADGQVVSIVDTMKGEEPGTIVHVPEAPLAGDLVGQRVVARIDWPRRYRMMRVHTMLHLLGAVVGAGVTGGSIRDDGSGRLDFDLPDVTLDKETIGRELNRLVEGDYPVAPRWVSEEELDANPELVRTMSVAPPRGQGRVRLLEISGVDLQACGGTHLARTGEVGAVQVRKIEKKGKHNRRVNVRLVDPD